MDIFMLYLVGVACMYAAMLGIYITRGDKPENGNDYILMPIFSWLTLLILIFIVIIEESTYE